jgi:hypothetical protein
MIDGRQRITDDFGSIPAQLQVWQASWPEMGVLILGVSGAMEQKT